MLLYTTNFGKLKATFHYSSQLQTWFLTRFAARFPTSSCGFATRFRLFFVENLVANRSKFAHMRDKWDVVKPVLSKFASGFWPACDQVFDHVCSWLEFICQLELNTCWLEMRVAWYDIIAVEVVRDWTPLVLLAYVYTVVLKYAFWLRWRLIT